MTLRKTAAQTALGDLLGRVWRRSPPVVRRWGVWWSQARFVVTVGGVVTDDEGRVLLLEHRFRAGGRWGIPGGFINPGEQTDDALRRELEEETGLAIVDLRLAFIRAHRRPRRVEIIYVCRPQSGSRATPRSIEITALDWFAPDRLPRDLTAGQRRMIARALAQADVREAGAE